MFPPDCSVWTVWVLYCNKTIEDNNYKYLIFHELGLSVSETICVCPSEHTISESFRIYLVAVGKSSSIILNC